MMGISKQIARDNLYETFRRLGLAPSIAFQFESLECTLTGITFNIDQLKHWKKNDD